MNRNISIGREFTAVILFIGIYLSFYRMPLFAEYVDKKPDTEEALTQSNYFTIYYEEGVDLKTVERRLSRGSFFFGGGTVSDSESEAAQKIAAKIDDLMERVKDMLDMHTKGRSIKLRIFKDRDSLRREYFKIFNTESDFKSFYIYKYDTIYISQEDISETVLAHEMGHAVVDHYFAVVPPEKVREVLASYVDAHLEEE